MKKPFSYINRCMKRGIRKLKQDLSLRKLKVQRNIPECVVALSYSQLYNDYSTVNPRELLKGIPTFDALCFILKMECDVHYTLHNPEEDIKHIHTLYNLCDIEEQRRIMICIRKYGRKLTLINTEGSMRFVRLALSCFTPEIEGYKHTKEDGKRILKAYLYCNQIWTNEQLNNSTFVFHNYVDASLRIDLPFSEFKFFKDFRTQMYKAIRFFQYAEKDSTLQIILRQFCLDRNVKDWKEYIQILFGFFDASMKAPVVDMSTAPKQAVDFMTPFILDQSEYPLIAPLTGKLPDTLRNKFLLRSTCDTNKVLILSSDLLVDKIYQGLKFDFGRIAETKALKNEKGKPIKQKTLNSMLGADFAEHHILYSLLDLIYSGDTTYVRKPGKDTEKYFSEKDGGSEPDYYMRNGNKLILFENKDVLFPVDVKFSKQLLKIKQSISYKIARFGKYPDYNHKEKNGKPKIKEEKEGLGQIYFNIYRLGCKPELYRAFDADIDQVDTIYPVLITYDNAYSALGVNAYANKKVTGIRRRLKKMFFEKYGKDVDLKRYNLNKPVIVDIDTLIMYSLKLQQQELNIFNLLDEYNSLVDKYDHNLSSFSTFMTDYHKLTAQGEKFIKMLYGEVLESNQKSITT